MSQEESPEKPETSETTSPTQWSPRAGGIFRTYSNFLHLNWSPTDILLRFGQLIPSPDGREWQVEERATITISWYHAKYLRDLLSGAIEGYEEANGAIKNPIMPKPRATP
jgi:Protein of unknown function (DUF3467)